LRPANFGSNAFDDDHLCLGDAMAHFSRLTLLFAIEPLFRALRRFELDIQNISGLTVQLRAERCGTGTGRIYTITVQCKDASGNTSTKTTTVTVKK
jgi:hypothetical protein